MTPAGCARLVLSLLLTVAARGLAQEPVHPQVTLGDLALIANVPPSEGCDPTTARAAGITELTYGADGRVSTIAFDPGGLTASCQTALTTLARLVVADVDDGSTESQMVILPMSPAFLACSAEPEAQRAESSVKVGGPIMTVTVNFTLQ